jgi:uncharacterized membrane protein YphA (DoxX/SURF4 family)
MENVFITIATLIGRTAGIIFIYAAINKLISIQLFAKTVKALPYLPQSLYSVIIYGVPILEFIVGALLVIGGFSQYVGLVAICLLMSFCFIAFTVINKNINISCACFGELATAPLSIKTIRRNLLLILLISPLVIWNSPSYFSLDSFLHSSARTYDYLAVLLLMLSVVVGLSFLVAKASSILRKPTI